MLDKVKTFVVTNKKYFKAAAIGLVAAAGALGYAAPEWLTSALQTVGLL